MTGDRMAEVLTYDALREIQYNERRSEKLYELNDDFYENIEEYFNRKGPKDDLTEIEMRNAKNILKDILDRRERKILSQALTTVRSGMRIDTKVMTSREEGLFKSLVTIIKDHREVVSKPVEKKSVKAGQSESGAAKKEEPTAKSQEPKAEPKTPRPKDPEPEETDQTTTYIRVKILQELPEMLGSDFKTYGPFKEGEVIELPEKNAEIFIEKEKAEISK
jgi:DNA replication initiation complex subunit (GINS family)